MNMQDIVVIKIPVGIQKMAARLDLNMCEALVLKSIRQYLSHLGNIREYRRKMRTDPSTKDAWYERKREDGRRYRNEKKRQALDSDD